MKFVSRKTLPMTATLLAAIFLSACSPSQKASNSNAKRYPLKGKVVSVDKQSRMVNVDAEAVPGFMEAMTMPYKVKPESELEQLSPGDSITADLVVLNDEYWLKNVKLTERSNPPPPKPVAQHVGLSSLRLPFAILVVKGVAFLPITRH